ncbi:glycoside hydrolase [Notoacmeibacter marinus]|uniref:glycoside hydrolase n=1 Tax=Notoacmeibacter marinus TaxID=1876515 RepID=UPI0013B050D5|nr:glycoside hydrolase [Notoacmeibacter marinus]
MTASPAMALGLAALSTCLAVTVAQAEILDLRSDGVSFRIDTDSLALSGAPDGSAPRILSQPELDARTADLVSSLTDASWTATTVDATYHIHAATVDGVLKVSVTAMQAGRLHWPVSAPRADVQYALPILGEGRRVPADHGEWQHFLTEVLDGLPAAEHLTQSFFTEQNDAYSTTWLLQTPWDADISYTVQDDRLSVGFRHEFTPLNLEEAYHVSVQFGPANWIDGALINRAHLQATGAFKSLKTKISDRPDVGKLAGAPHIYLWEKGPLKPQDVTAWRRFMRVFGNRRDNPGTLSYAIWPNMPEDMRTDVNAGVEQAQGEDGFVSKYSRTVMTRALNTALPKTIARRPVKPLPGGHDPEAGPGYVVDFRDALISEFGDNLAPPETWGGGMSTGIVKRLSSAGIRHAWLGVENWLDALWHPEAVTLAKDTGYLVGTYDSYASAHAQATKQTWQTAQMGDAIFDSAAFHNETGAPRSGFRGKGAYLNAAAVAEYARQRTGAVSSSAGLNSYFLDVDATGLVFEDYTDGRQMTRQEAYEAIRNRLAFTSGDLGLVLGSETGTAAFAGQIDFSHGIATPVFDWMDPRMRRDPEPEFYIGAYWPVEAPARFFAPTRVPPLMERVIYDPAFRLPLYQIALHDAVVTTHHWHFGSLKPEGLQTRNALFELLYMVPPLYHLSEATIERDLPAITRQVTAFAPLHERLMTQAMVGFRHLSKDFLLQETRFENGTVIVANFGPEPAALPDGLALDPSSVLIRTPGNFQKIIDLSMD